MVFVVFICFPMIISKAEKLLIFIVHFSPTNCKLSPIFMLYCCSLDDLQVLINFSSWHFAGNL